MLQIDDGEKATVLRVRHDQLVQDDDQQAGVAEDSGILLQLRLYMYREAHLTD